MPVSLGPVGACWRGAQRMATLADWALYPPTGGGGLGGGDARSWPLRQNLVESEMGYFSNFAATLFFIRLGTRSGLLPHV